MLYLHIGTSKAGSTTIQHYLSKTDTAAFGLGQLDCFGRGNAPRLAAASNTRNARKYWVHGRKYMTRDAFEANRITLWEDLARELAQSDCRDFTASSEYLYRHFYGAPKGLAAFRDQLLAHFGDVRIILYLRDQRAWLRSFYAQTVVGPEGSTRDYADFIAQSRKQPARWNYRAAVRMWVKVFGRDRMVIVPFHPANFFRNDLVADFLSHIAEDAARQHDVAGTGRAWNTSPGAKGLQARRQLNALSVTDDNLAGRGLRYLAGRRFFNRAGGRDDLPDSHDADILDMVSEGNAWLNERFFTEFPVPLPVSPSLDQKRMA
jgi:hypothetical protein